MEPLVPIPGRVVQRARLHIGSPVFGYLLSCVLIGATGYLRVTQPALAQFPFLFFYPAIALASFFGGLGPGIAAIVLGAVTASLYSLSPPSPVNWLALAIAGPLVSMAFARLRDVRDRSRALARDLAEFKFIGDHASDWILLLEESGQIRYVNHRASTDLGLVHRELIGRQLESLVTEAQRPALRVALEMARSGIAKPIELAFERRDKSLALVELGCTAVRTGDDNVIYAAARDISERRQIEKRLSEIRQWESLEVLAGGLAHDFNNLLTTILGNADIAKDVLPRDHEAVPMLDAIITAGERSSELVNMLLATAGHRSRYSEQLQLNQLLDTTLNNRRLPAKILVAKEMAGDTAFLGDRRSFETLFWSLISNAAEAYGPEGGEIRVAIRRGPASSPPSTDFEEGDPGTGECIGIIVEDRGSGMSPEILKRAFDPFFSTRFTGRGLGLAAVRGIVRAYSGKLLLETAIGEGTRVEVWLPVRNPGEGIPRNPIAPTAAQNANRALP